MNPDHTRDMPRSSATPHPFDPDPVTSGPPGPPTIDRRRVLRWGGAAAIGAAASATPLWGGGIRPAAAIPLTHLGPASAGGGRIPRDTLPVGAYDRYLAELGAEHGFSGVVVLAHRGRTVLSRSFGLADETRGIANGDDIAFNLSSAGKPFLTTAILQLAQQGRLRLTDTIGTHLSGFAPEIAERVTIHHLLSGTSGLSTADEDIDHISQSRDEVRDRSQAWVRQAQVVAPPGTPTGHSGTDVVIPAMIVEAVSGTTYWDHVQEHIFRPCGMTGSGFFTRPEWLADEHLAHPYMTVADGSQVDALNHLDLGSSLEWVLGRNPGRAFIDSPGDGGFVTASDLVRFIHGLGDGTVLDRPWTDVLLGAKFPTGPSSFAAYGLSGDIIGGQWYFQRAGANPGVGANWSWYPDSGWVGVILTNRDSAEISLLDVMAREVEAVTGVVPGGGGGG